MSDVQHAQAAEPGVEPWVRSIVSADSTHHVFNGRPLYSPRFDSVLAFHDPGLAPARDRSGAFHIDGTGGPVYVRRFRQTWGFYDALAAAEDQDGWLHIRPNGSPLSSERFAWCGNFQENLCTVRERDSRYLHLTTNGSPAYSERHLYAGDFRDGTAVVRYADDGRCGHIDTAGRPLHRVRFHDLDVFHKGFARARDEHGWFHVDRAGRPAYGARFAMVEPFYNGTAFAETGTGDRVLIGADGRVCHVVASATR